MDKICIRMYGKQSFEKILCIAPSGRCQYGIVAISIDPDSLSKRWGLKPWGGGKNRGFVNVISDKCKIT